MIYNFTKYEGDKIISRFGKSFYEKLKRDIVFYADRWKLEKMQLVDYFSFNCIFLCSSKLFGDVVLKIGGVYSIENEYNTLLEYNGKKFCRVFDCDLKNWVILIEQIIPATQLRAEKDMQKRLSVFMSLYSGLHIAPKNPKLYPTYIGWVNSATDSMNKLVASAELYLHDYTELYLYMKKAKEICANVSRQYNRQMLLHGDLHHDNILLGQSGYRLIDPKGVVGDPVFDIPRFIINECDDTSLSGKNVQNILKVINFFANALGIDNNIIKQCYFVETVMAQCWRVERSKTPYLENIKFVEKLLNN